MSRTRAEISVFLVPAARVTMSFQPVSVRTNRDVHNQDLQDRA
jgi:hypothetical protein